MSVGLYSSVFSSENLRFLSVDCYSSTARMCFSWNCVFMLISMTFLVFGVLCWYRVIASDSFYAALVYGYYVFCGFTDVNSIFPIRLQFLHVKANSCEKLISRLWSVALTLHNTNLLTSESFICKLRFFSYRDTLKLNSDELYPCKHRWLREPLQAYCTTIF